MREVWGSILRFGVSELVLLTNKEPKEVVNRHAEQYVYNITLDHSRIWKARGEWDIALPLHIAKPHQCNTLFKISLNFFFFPKRKKPHYFFSPDKAALSDNLKYEHGLEHEQLVFFCEIVVSQSIQPSQTLHIVIIQPTTFSSSSWAEVTVISVWVEAAIWLA